PNPGLGIVVVEPVCGPGSGFVSELRATDPPTERPQYGNTSARRQPRLRPSCARPQDTRQAWNRTEFGYLHLFVWTDRHGKIHHCGSAFASVLVRSGMDTLCGGSGWSSDFCLLPAC